MCLNEILKQHAEEFANFRRLLFPLIGFEVITGFNIYEKPEKFADSPIVVSHLHSELEEGKAYRKEVERMIGNCCTAYSIQKIQYEKIDRQAAYRLRKGWEADEYYDHEGSQLSYQSIADRLAAGETVIGCGIQNNLQVAISDIHDLNALLNAFSRKLNFFDVDAFTGLVVVDANGVAKVNDAAVHDAWQVPVFVIRASREPCLGRAYPTVSEISIDKPGYLIDILVGKKEQYLSRSLLKAGLTASMRPAYVNKLFADYLDETLNVNKFRRFVETL